MNEKPRNAKKNSDDPQKPNGFHSIHIALCLGSLDANRDILTICHPAFSSFCFCILTNGNGFSLIRPTTQICDLSRYKRLAIVYSNAHKHTHTHLHNLSLEPFDFAMQPRFIFYATTTYWGRYNVPIRFVRWHPEPGGRASLFCVA